MSKARPRVSVLMAVFNGGPYLATALQSVLAQSLTDFELIVVDDGSTDDSLAVIRRHEDARIVVLTGPNRGLPSALNAGLARARAPWIARMDADDIALPNRLERQLAVAEGDPELVVLGAQCLLIDAAGERRGQTRIPPDHDRIWRNMLWGFGPSFAHPAVLIRRATLAAVGGYRARFKRTQDVDLWLRLGQRGRLACLPEALLCLRQHEANASHTDHGRLQTLYGLAARASYFNVRAGGPDPVEFPTASWELYLQALGARCEDEGVFRVNAARRQLRELLAARGPGAAGIGRVLSGLLRRPELLVGLAPDPWRRLVWKLHDEAQTTAAAVVGEGA